MLTMLIYLISGHALADYPLQGDFLSKTKNRTAPIPGIPWWQALGAHAFIHTGFVTLITQMPLLGLCEFIIHAITDDRKCQGKLSFNQDQVIHIACKFLWVIIATYWK